MSVLNNAVNVLSVSAWHCSAFSHSNIYDKTTLVLLLEELENI